MIIPFTSNKFAFALLRASFAQLIDIALRKSRLALLWQHLFEANGIKDALVTSVIKQTSSLNIQVRKLKTLYLKDQACRIS